MEIGVETDVETNVEIGIKTGVESVFFFFFVWLLWPMSRLAIVWFLGLVLAWWPVSCGCCGGFLVVLTVAVVFGGCPSRYRVVGFDFVL